MVSTFSMCFLCLINRLFSAENQLSSILQKVSIPIHHENACNGLVGWKESIIRLGPNPNTYLCRSIPGTVRGVRPAGLRLGKIH